jgi:hypothetical protein
MSGDMHPLPQYAFMAWCSAKAQGQLYLFFYLYHLHLVKVKGSIKLFFSSVCRAFGYFLLMVMGYLRISIFSFSQYLFLLSVLPSTSKL